MKANEWIEQIREAGLLCDEYCDKVDLAMNKTQLFDLILDANGISYIPEMAAKGHPVPYETITREFGSYINGRYVRDKDGYTSSLYCQYGRNVTLSETLTCFLGCKGIGIRVADYDICEIFLDAECQVTIRLGRDSRLVVNYWGDESSIRTAAEYGDRITYKHHKK